MPAEEQAELRPSPPALPDGSMPTYDAHPLPGTADGESLSGPFAWGPDLDRLDHLPHTDSGPPTESTLLVVALIIVAGVALSVLVAAISVRV
ncbi:hypothetical protein [Kribbella speibonae]|uniref:Uncharacterized protein n=1 Tax=Kribbella speibonae TaxID=1572660 RepID=A0ABY2AAF7_9ACTN|nr:hypothetical protein [Kribbella speibonae]TCC24625.1 hypothetical protein E0H58_10360 [Kribbella speibonae]